MTALLTRDTTYAGQTDAQAYDLLMSHGSGQTDALNALTRAERHGHTRTSRAAVFHTGYADSAETFNAATALYRVTF